MLSVAHIMGRMSPSGTELQLAGMLRAAHGQHWLPTLCVLRPGYPLAQQLAGEGIEVIELDSGAGYKPQRMRALRQLTRSGRFDVVHTSLWGASAFGRASVVGPNRPAVVMSERRVEDFRSRANRLVDRSLAGVTDEWIGNSHDVCTFIERAHGVPGSRVHLIPNGLDASIFCPAPAAKARPSGPLRIGALGRLVHQKGFDILIQALPLVLAAVPAEVIIVGEGELRTALEEQARDLPVTFPGALEGPRAVADYLRGLDVFVMPSRYEGLPNAVLEAVACGIPVVATNTPGMREAAGPAVELVPAEDPSALAAALIAALRCDSPPALGPRPHSFDDVAVHHRQVFELALRRRAHRSDDVATEIGEDQCA